MKETDHQGKKSIVQLCVYIHNLNHKPKSDQVKVKQTQSDQINLK